MNSETFFLKVHIPIFLQSYSSLFPIYLVPTNLSRPNHGTPFFMKHSVCSASLKMNCPSSGFFITSFSNLWFDNGLLMFNYISKIIYQIIRRILHRI